MRSITGCWVSCEYMISDIAIPTKLRVVLTLLSELIKLRGSINMEETSNSPRTRKGR